MPIRVIAGSAKGRKLKLVPGDSTRPIMDRVKEALFSIIGRDIIDAIFLDLFAGTGSVGIEALSRGAAHATFIDLERAAISTIQDNLKATGLANKALVRRADALNILKQPPPQVFDFIYIAPPQYKTLWLTTMQTLDTQPAWLAPHTQVIVQINPQEHHEITFQRMIEVDQRRYGNTLLWFFEPKDEHKDDQRLDNETLKNRVKDESDE